MKTHLLCIGAETVLLQSRCAVLEIAGYQTDCVELPRGSDRLNAEIPPVVVLCSSLPVEHKRRLLEVLPPTTKVVDLDPASFIGPNELLERVRKAC